MNIIARKLFAEVTKLKDLISADEQEKMVTDIINVFKEHKLTYNQSFEILDLVKVTLSTLSKAVHL